MKKREQLIVVDLGTRLTKAVALQIKGDGMSLLDYAIQEAPATNGSFSKEAFGEHLRALLQSMGCRIKQISLAVGVSDSFLRLAEMPMMPVSDMRQMLKYNSKNYLQQDLPDHVFDCHIVALPGGGRGEGGRSPQKCRVLVTGIRQSLLSDLQAGVRAAGCSVFHVFPGIIGPLNAFERSQPEKFAKELVALVDLGYRGTSISILQNGELMMNRVVGIGSERLIAALAQAFDKEPAEVERQLESGIGEEMTGILQLTLAALGRELRASIDFFEHQHEKVVSTIYVSGGVAGSPQVVESLQGELVVPCQSWDPTSFLNLRLSPEQRGKIEGVAPQLAVAIGSAVAANFG